MKKHCSHAFRLLLVGAIMSAAGCQQSSSPAASAAGKSADVAVDAPTPPARMVLVVTKNATCGCCSQWVDEMKRAGFAVEVHDVDNLDPIKTRLGVPVGKGACHTAEVGGYFVEGHVPAEDIKRLLKDRPKAKGLVLPGMPPGSPGMDMQGDEVRPYTVELVRADGSTEPFAQHGPVQNGQ